MIQLFKNALQSIPPPIGYLLAHFPYRYRPFMGKPYRKCQKLIVEYETWGTDQKKAFVLNQLQRMTEHANRNIVFYKELYRKNHFAPESLKCFEDIQRIPIITKEMLREVPLEERSAPAAGRYVTNTGGSSGAALHFYITPTLIPYEWGHMHRIWRKFGYREDLLKICFAGRNLGARNVAYDGLRHQYTASVYRDLDAVTNDLIKITKLHPISYLHGYPSALYEFASYCERFRPQLVSLLRKTLRGAFLGSEFPVQEWRHRIETVFDIPTVSWYGHTERAILAWEKGDQFTYYPFQTYGYCEVKQVEGGGGWRLLGTSYRNFASPFIRYDTGDDVEPIETDSGLLRTFRVRHGRIGEFVIDKNGTRIPLTALIFGRHHRLLNIARFIQVFQPTPGRMVVLATFEKGVDTPVNWNEWFDSTGMNMGVEYRRLDKPILTISGKISLKVSDEALAAASSSKNEDPMN